MKTGESRVQYDEPPPKDKEGRESLQPTSTIGLAGRNNSSPLHRDATRESLPAKLASNPYWSGYQPHTKFHYSPSLCQDAKVHNAGGT